MFLFFSLLLAQKKESFLMMSIFFDCGNINRGRFIGTQQIHANSVELVFRFACNLCECETSLEFQVIRKFCAIKDASVATVQSNVNKSALKHVCRNPHIPSRYFFFFYCCCCSFQKLVFHTLQ